MGWPWRTWGWESVVQTADEKEWTELKISHGGCPEHWYLGSPSHFSEKKIKKSGFNYATFCMKTNKHIHTPSHTHTKMPSLPWNWLHSICKSRGNWCMHRKQARETTSQDKGLSLCIKWQHAKSHEILLVLCYRRGLAKALRWSQFSIIRQVQCLPEVQKTDFEIRSQGYQGAFQPLHQQEAANKTIRICTRNSDRPLPSRP